jgi:hypothetical protein
MPHDWLKSSVSGGVNVNSQHDASIQGDVVGRDKIVSITVKAPSAEGITCPLDNHGDMIQKVSAVISGSPITGLAYKLTLPSEPHPTSNVFAWIFIVCFAVSPFMWCAVLGINLFGNGLDYSLVYLIDFGLLITAIAIIIIGGRDVINKKPQQKADYEAKHAKWVRARTAWEKCYYCHRHDIVFLAGEPDTASPNNLYAFLSK